MRSYEATLACRRFRSYLREGMGLNLAMRTVAVHLAAAKAQPRAYLAATAWRLRGKRLRSQLRFAPLLGAQPAAYQLWQMREPRAIAGVDTPDARPSIVALVDAGAVPGAGQGSLLDATLRSLAAEGLPAHVIATPIAAALTQAAARIDWAGQPWLMPLAAGDTLARGAVRAYRAAAHAPQASLIYADDDLVDHTGRRSAPHFKPDWNAELFRHFDYLSNACIIHADRAALERAAVRSDWAYCLVAGAAGEGAPLHIRRMFHHRRVRPQPRVPAAPEAAGRELPPASVIVPTRNRADLLETCLAGLAATAYPDLEVIVVDNDSDDPRTLCLLDGLDPARHRVLRHAGPFNFSAINNRAAAGARGRVLCLLNNDIEVIRPDWLATMVGQALRPEVGAVGARLLYPDGRIQHAGVVLGIAGAAGMPTACCVPARRAISAATTCRSSSRR